MIARRPNEVAAHHREAALARALHRAHPDLSCAPEVCNDGFAIAVDQDVVRLDVAQQHRRLDLVMNDAARAIVHAMLIIRSISIVPARSIDLVLERVV